PGAGATFTLALPRVMLSPAAAAAAVRPAPPPRNGARHTPLPVPAQARPLEWEGPHPHAPLVLVVEDDDDLRGFLGDVLSARDHSTNPFHAPELLARVDAHALLGRLMREIAHKERLATLGMVAATVAHQVRNPLSALKNTVESLKERVEGGPRLGGMFDLID